jgi:hypothetical protein
MKLTPIFNNIKERIILNENIKLVTWYNNQDAEGILHTTPAVFIEFPEAMAIQQLQGQYQQMPLKIRLWLISKIISQADGSVSDTLMQEHETLAQDIYNRLHLKRVIEDNEENVTNSFVRTLCELDMSNPGIVITKQDFECTAYQRPVNAETTITITGIGIAAEME